MNHFAERRVVRRLGIQRREYSFLNLCQLYDENNLPGIPHLPENMEPVLQINENGDTIAYWWNW